MRILDGLCLSRNLNVGPYGTPTVVNRVSNQENATNKPPFLLRNYLKPRGGTSQKKTQLEPSQQDVPGASILCQAIWLEPGRAKTSHKKFSWSQNEATFLRKLADTS